MTIRVGTAPVSWGIYEFENIEPKYPYERVLDEIVETGYTGVELGPWGYLPTNPIDLREALQPRGLQLLSSYVPVALKDAAAHDAGEAHALQVGRLLASLGAEMIVLADDNCKDPELLAQAGRVTEPRLSDDEWDTFAAGVNRIARRLHDETGLKVTFHHHIAGYVESPEETRILMDKTDPDLVGLCLDTGHWMYVGGDPVGIIKELGSRVNYLHFKDCDPQILKASIDGGRDYFQAVEAGVFCELGKGGVDFAGVIAAMEDLEYDGWTVVEQDVLTDDLDAPKRMSAANRAFLRDLGL